MKRLLCMPVVLLLFLSISFAQDNLETRKNIESGMMSSPLGNVQGLMAVFP